MPPKTLAAFNHSMHIANTITKRQGELIEVLTAVCMARTKNEISKKEARERTALAHAKFYSDMTEIAERIRENS